VTIARTFAIGVRSGVGAAINVSEGLYVPISEEGLRAMANKERETNQWKNVRVNSQSTTRLKR